MLSPLQFIPLIEQTALIGPVTLHVIDSALRQIVTWRELGLHFGMSVNLSARNLLDPALPDQIEELLREHGVSPAELTVEVTESATMADPERAVGVLRALRASGIGVSVDDFGTGNASIAYLTRLPATEIKIDRSFIADVCDDKRAEAIVRSTSTCHGISICASSPRGSRPRLSSNVSSSWAATRVRAISSRARCRPRR